MFIVVVSIISLLSTFSTGCGGGATTTSGVPTETTGAPTATPTAAPTAAAPAALQKKALPVPRTFQSNPQTPAWFQDALSKKKVILLEFYTKGDTTARKIRPEIQSVYEKYSTDILLIILDTDEAEKSAALADQFGVSYTPHISVINKDGKVIREFRGYVDSKVLEQAVYDALHKKSS